jgi:hypothetical protein
MPSARRGLSLLVAGVGLTVLLLSQVGTIQADAGRDFPRCVQSCNETRTACRIQCNGDCDLMFPLGPERDACSDACADTCSENSKECKGICQNIKNPPSDEEP